MADTNDSQVNKNNNHNPSVRDAEGNTGFSAPVTERTVDDIDSAGDPGGTLGTGGRTEQDR